ncbi:PLP-dependent aminotransferase family protein [Streptomyces chattanoogensis]|uniref:GntR family transcriptional regulator n=1 Tax=Streptomyces chattanoogensis TaxID=66876 RepID=A0A0N0GXM1_9ACTN|nr:PLP-dependent aminotransferase family protein [Streptomyces chattanoogensis]KPC61171.1 GntR family transcriptional regulator [Streptomyces chattanoogensis]
MNRTPDDPADRSLRAPGSASPGADFLQLNIGDAPAGGRSDWLVRQLRLAISDGRLPVGSKLPATRVLAADLRVSRGVVTEAYQRLTEDGQVVGRGRAGTIVVAAPLAAPAPVPADPPPAPPPTAPFLAPPGPDVFDALRTAPARIDLSPGVPDLAAFPRAAWLRAERAVLRDAPASDLGYGDPRGAPALRRAVVNWLARNRGIRADPDEVLIVAGTAQALGLIAQVLQRDVPQRDVPHRDVPQRDGISAIAVEDPGSLGARQHLRYWGLATPPVPVDDQGIRVDALRASGARAVMLTPAHQFPTGVVLGGRRRRELLHWAATEDGLIIEDDYDAEHRYDRPPVPALRAMLAEHVCYAGSVSKLLAPALRVGWLLPPPRFLDAFVNAKRFADLGNAALPQYVLAGLMESGELERRLRLLRTRHRRRRDAMIAAIRRYLPGAVVHGAAAGLHLTLTFEGPTDTPLTDASGADVPHANISDTDLAAAALAAGVKAHPLSWHTQRPHPPGLVLGYASSSPAAITEGVSVVGEVLRRL